MKILMADDVAMHRGFFKDSLSALNLPYTVLGEAEDGKQLVDLFKQFKGHGIDFVFCDIRMPNMDGLSALVKIMSIDPSAKMIMVSSEDESRMQMLNQTRGDQDKATVDLAKKLDLIEKVAHRIRNDIIEAGKINSILEACEKLALDPMDIAKKYQARGFLHKPYDSSRLKTLLESIQKGLFAKVV